MKRLYKGNHDCIFLCNRTLYILIYYIFLFNEIKVLVKRIKRTRSTIKGFLYQILQNLSIVYEC